MCYLQLIRIVYMGTKSVLIENGQWHLLKMCILRIYLLFVFYGLILNVNTKSIRGNKRDGAKILFLLRNSNARPGTLNGNIESTPQVRTIGPLFARPIGNAFAADTFQDPVLANNEINRIFLNALIMALQQTDYQAIKPVTENQEDSVVQRVEANDMPMIDSDVTRQFIIGFIKGAQNPVSAVQTDMPEADMPNYEMRIQNKVA